LNLYQTDTKGRYYPELTTKARRSPLWNHGDSENDLYIYNHRTASLEKPPKYDSKMEEVWLENYKWVVKPKLELKTTKYHRYDPVNKKWIIKPEDQKKLDSEKKMAKTHEESLQEEHRRENLIKKKIREIAIEQLKGEGLL